MNSFREVKDDILKDWLDYRDQDYFSSCISSEDKKHRIYFDEISNKILNSVPKEYRPFIHRQLEHLDDNYTDYICYWNEKYYRHGFCDGVQIISGCIEK